MHLAVVFVSAAVLVAASVATAADPSAGYVRPTGLAADRPVWGVRGGLAVGLWPTGGPRGLLRVYAPYLGQTGDRMINFVAVEPVVGGRRDLSELQASRLDKAQGKAMWTADAVDLAHPPPFTATPARGVVSADGESLLVFVLVERFDNGAEPVVRVTLRADRPHEVELQTFSTAGGAAMSSCVLTATMGNFARLRHLHLPGRTVEAADVFRGKALDGMRFFPWAEWPAATVSATGDADPPGADAPPGWRYVGRPAVQAWSTDATEGVVARVNGRDTFWASHAAIPGGPAFENVELASPFRPGQSFRFSVTPAP